MKCRILVREEQIAKMRWMLQKQLSIQTQIATWHVLFGPFYCHCQLHALSTKLFSTCELVFGGFKHAAGQTNDVNKRWLILSCVR